MRDQNLNVNVIDHMSVTDGAGFFKITIYNISILKPPKC